MACLCAILQGKRVAKVWKWWCAHKIRAEGLDATTTLQPSAGLMFAVHAVLTSTSTADFLIVVRIDDERNLADLKMHHRRFFTCSWLCSCLCICGSSHSWGGGGGAKRWSNKSEILSSNFCKRQQDSSRQSYYLLWQYWCSMQHYLQFHSPVSPPDYYYTAK